MWTLQLLFFTSINLMISSVFAFSLLMSPQSDKMEQITGNLARVAVAEKLAQLRLTSEKSSLVARQSCVEPRANDALVVGKGDSLDDWRSIDGIPATDATRFYYRANVTTHCSGLHINCYDIGAMHVEGNRKVSPRL